MTTQLKLSHSTTCLSSSSARPVRRLRSTPPSSLLCQATGTFPACSTAHTQPEFYKKTHGVVAKARRSGGATRQVTRMMPIGVPRVPYRHPRSGRWMWVDIYNCLYRERLVLLSKPIDEELGNQLVATMLYLDSEDHKPINLYINCVGGEIIPALALHDTMKHIESDVFTCGFGGCMGMSGFLLAMGKKGQRYVLPNTRIMVHHPSGSARGTAMDIQNEARELMRIRAYVNRLLAEATGKPVEQIHKDFQRNRYFDAQEAKEYGLVDTVLKPPRTENF